MEKVVQDLPNYVDFIIDLNEHFIYAEYSGSSHVNIVFRPRFKEDVPER